MADPRLTIIIVNWNTRELLRDCLSSLGTEDPEVPREVIVVDNASRDGSPEMVAREFPAARLMANDENVGFARANNQALREARGRYILLLNSDTTTPDPGIFRDWLAFLDEHPEIGASGCRLVTADGRHWVGDAGFRPSPRTVCCYSFFLSHLFPRRCPGLFLNDGRPDGPRMVDWISGAALMIRRDILRRVGLLDEGLFMYAEDVEWGCRVRKHGYSVCYLPQFVIVHLVGASSGKRGGEGFSTLWLENLRRLHGRLNPGQSLLWFDAIFSAGLLLRSILYYAIYLQTGEEKDRTRSRRMREYFNFLINRRREGP
ncbi:MAG: glycosyltransferase family 2 protein [Pseudomonadota bacterium]|nr:glycosyltransferase family 2 protein [Pseudomonadota bacterium]